MESRINFRVVLTAAIVAVPQVILAQSGPPAGYALTPASPITSDYQLISQMAFNPNDPNHLYATHYNYNLTNGFVTRYDYSLATGQVSNPVNIVQAPAGGLGATLGLGFFNDNLYVASTHGSTGGIFQFQPLGNGMYGNGVEFINNIPTGEHQVDQIQIVGKSLYVGIGTQTDQGTNESVYNGTVGIISDLSKANTSASGANNLSLANVLTDTDPGKLHVFASGFRNPYGVRFDATGHAWVTDNGADNPATPDLLYSRLNQGDRGVFPNASSATHQPLANLGLHTAAAGFSWLPSGPRAGSALVALFNTLNTQTFTPSLPGEELVTVDPTTGAVAPFLTNSPLLENPIDIIQDPLGRLLVADFGPNFANKNNPNSGGIYLITATATAPEPTAGTLLVITLALGTGVPLVRRWARLRQRVG